MKVLLIVRPDGTYCLMAERECEFVVAELPARVQDDLAEDLARKAVPRSFRDVWDYGYVVGEGGFDLFTAERAAMDRERRWTMRVVEAMVRALEPITTTEGDTSTSRPVARTSTWSPAVLRPRKRKTHD